MRIERITTVEYLEHSMSENLLCKFPEVSAFGFNYAESGIWSPLLPRGQNGSETTPGSSKKSRGTKGKAMNRKKMDVVSKRLDFFSPNPTTGWTGLLKAMARRIKVQEISAIEMILPTL